MECDEASSMHSDGEHFYDHSPGRKRRRKQPPPVVDSDSDEGTTSDERASQEDVVGDSDAANDEGANQDMVGEKQHPLDQDAPLPPPCCGPTSAKEVPLWVQQGLLQLDVRGWLQNVIDKFKFGVRLFTDWTGAGTVEQACNMIVHGLGRMGHVVEDKHASCGRACDNDSVCQQVLLHHTGPFRPEHVQCDIMDRVDNDTVAALLRIAQQHYPDEERAKQPPPHGDAKGRRAFFRERKRRGMRMVTDVINFLKETKPKFVKSSCKVHDTRCPLDSSLPKSEVPHQIRIWAAGHNCQPWSSYGARGGWLAI